MTVRIGGEATRSTLSVHADGNGRWTRAIVTSGRDRVTVSRVGTRLAVHADDQHATTAMAKDAALHDSGAPALMSHVVRAYGMRARGRRRFPLCVLPGIGATLVVERHRPVEYATRGRRAWAHLFSYTVSDSSARVWTDDGARVLVVSAPAHATAYVRHGCTALFRRLVRDGAPRERLLPLKVRPGVQVRMRDGVKLATTIYRPRGRGKYPVILIRTPYGPALDDLQARFYGRRGFVVAVQNVRGRFGSQGAWEPFVGEGKDGYDTIEWLARQPWCTGKVGMLGGSYSGWVQWWAAVERPPHLVTIVPMASPSDPFYSIPYEHGVLYMLGALWWLEVTAGNMTTDLSGAGPAQAWTRNWRELLRPLPVIDLDRVVLGRRDRTWRTWINHPSNDDYWRRLSFLHRLATVSIPVFHQTGWFDALNVATGLNYLTLGSHGHRHQKLVIGPWPHGGETRSVGGRDFGPAAVPDLLRTTLRWFERWLKERDTGILDEPLVDVFVTGTNRWRRADAYPLPGTTFQRWYLRSGIGRRATEGRLTRREPVATERSGRFTYDPGDPTPDGDILGHARQTRVPVLSGDRPAPTSARRRDILTYRSGPFKRTCTIVGPVSLRLCAASSARDTDWHARLLEVDARGRAVPIAQGRLRARYRASTRRPRLLKPGAVYDYDLDLGAVGVALARGARLQLEVASAAYPTYSRNLNTGGHSETETTYVVARQTVFHARPRPSYLLLPVVPE